MAVITGGASGQGQAACRLFAQAGARVVADRNGTGAEQTAEEIRAAGGEAVAVPADISREADVEAMIQKALDQFGRLDILFNNAGVGYSSSARFKMANVVETPEHAWDAILAINLKGAAMACKHAIPVMAAQGGGAIINNASINALVGLPSADAYTAAKGGIVALTRILAVERAVAEIDAQRDALLDLQLAKRLDANRFSAKDAALLGQQQALIDQHGVLATRHNAALAQQLPIAEIENLCRLGEEEVGPVGAGPARQPYT